MADAPIDTGSQTRTVGGRYRLDEAIGSGGMAEVYLGRDIRLGRDVAVKVLRADLAADLSFQQRFRREAQAAASLSAPHIVSVYDTGEEQVDGRTVPWIVMELVEGRTLRDVLRTEGRLLPQRALEVAADVCAALEVAHEAGIVHRDIKPGNVMLTRTGEVKVMDFGIARPAEDAAAATRTSAVLGTAAYLSPEQARGENVDPRSDVYSTGCLLYELVTGSPPFVGDSPVAVAYQHVREDPVVPSAYDRDLPPAIDRVVLTAMAKSPAARYQSAGQMRADLLRAAVGAPVAAPPPVRPLVDPVPVRTGPLADARSRTRIGVYALFGVFLLGIGALVASQVRSLTIDNSGLVRTPPVVGLSLPDAQTQLADAGLVVDQQVNQKYDDKPAGSVLSQEPVPGIVANIGGTVHLSVSLGPQRTVVPQVVGLQEDEARRAVNGANLQFNGADSEAGPVAAGTVLRSDPAPGTELKAGQSVRVTISTGRIDVPNTIGKSQAEAVGLLQDAGFNVGVKPKDSDRPAGIVVAQDPLGQGARPGSDVVISVARTPPPAPVFTPAPTFRPRPTASPTDSPTDSPQPSGSPSPSPSPRASASPSPTRRP